jgi:hypothetical protein
VFQIQTGVRYGDFENEDLNTEGDHIEHTTSLRYGILENVELRSAFKIRSDQVDKESGSQDFGGLNFWNVGIRYNVKSGSGYQPSFGLQADVGLRWVDEDYQADNLAPRFMLIHGQRLSDTFVLTTNWAIRWNGNDSQARGSYVLNLGFPIGGGWSSFVETYGELVGDDLDYRFDTGLGYLVNNDFKLDISGGYGHNEGLTDWFVDSGISWRIKRK